FRPHKCGHYERPHCEATMTTAPHPAGCRVLLVDDNHDFLASVERFLSVEPGIAVVGRAASGREALDQVGRLRPEVVVMDLSMPEMDGLEATQRLKPQPG